MQYPVNQLTGPYFGVLHVGSHHTRVMYTNRLTTYATPQLAAHIYMHACVDVSDWNAFNNVVGMVVPAATISTLVAYVGWRRCGSMSAHVCDFWSVLSPRRLSHDVHTRCLFLPQISCSRSYVEIDNCNLRTKHYRQGATLNPYCPTCVAMCMHRNLSDIDCAHRDVKLYGMYRIVGTQCTRTVFE